jgi:hypothetical protein
MRYDEFRDQWRAALIEVGLMGGQDRPEETIDLITTTRRWQVAGILFPQRAEPFHVSAEVEFRWSPFESARSYTCEEDLLAEVLGRRRSHANTEPRLLRIDVTYRASLPHGQSAPLPTTDVWVAWVRAVGERLDGALTPQRPRRDLPSWRGEPEIGAGTDADGAIVLKDVAVQAFQMIVLPRCWDDPRRQAKERSAHKDIDQLAARFRRGFDDWMAGVTALVGWLRHAPKPAPKARRGRGGPVRERGGRSETTH